MCFSNCPYEDWEGECRAGNLRGNLVGSHCSTQSEEELQRMEYEREMLAVEAALMHEEDKRYFMEW